MKRPRRLKNPVLIGRHGPTSVCLLCGAQGVIERRESAHMLVWYRVLKDGGIDIPEIGREPWPHTSRSPYCTECWMQIKKRSGG